MLTRRHTLKAGLATGAAVALLPAAARARSWSDILDEFTGGVEPGEGGIFITAPEIAENGNAVPVTVDAPGATEIVLVATDNPTPGIGRFRFMEAAGSSMVATRIRLGGTQDIVAVARFPDGRLTKAQVEVKVTIGGCGG
jgi:sulfur-oxidizing protein SoxY